MAVQLQRISDEEAANRHAAIHFARHSARLEGIALPPSLEIINQSFISGHIDDAEHVRRCLEAIDCA